MSKITNVNIHPSWKEALSNEFSQPYFSAIKQYLIQEKQAGKAVYPPGKLIFNAFDATPFDQVKVVIIGQDPYHGPGQAMGLSFSVPRNVAIPPSLVNMYKELNTDLNLPIPNHGDLTDWANQGVFLLNASLTVLARQANSHQKIGWQKFTDAVIRTLSQKREGIIFLLWGGFAKKKASLIDKSKHHVLTSGHPSPLSANRGYWFGNKHFSKANKLLEGQGLVPIDWELK